MKTKLLPFFYCASLFLSSAVHANAQVSTADSVALVDLYHATNGDQWTNHTNWLSNLPVSQWYGVYINDNRVTSVSLGYNNLSGIIPISIGALDDLYLLDLSNNHITGSIPTTLGNLNRLNALGLNDNALTGSLPAIFNEMQILTELYAGNNQLSGALPPCLTSLGQLTTLYLQNNQLSGDFPAIDSGKMPNLHTLDVSFNQLTGNLLDVLKNQKDLWILQAGHNRFSGSMPTHLAFEDAGNFMYWFDVSDNQFSGTIPDDFYALKELFYLYLNNNQLSGQVQESIGNFNKLQQLSLAGNQFTGMLPSAIGSLQDALNIDVSRNHFSGKIPASLTGYPYLQSLNLSNNMFTGTIPPSIATSPLLANLNLSYNQLRGEIPKTFAFNTHLSAIDLSHNLLMESINYRAAGKERTLSANLAYNRFTFNGLEYVAANMPNTVYSPQAETTIGKQGNVLTASAGGSYRNTIYNWYKTGTGSAVVSGADSFYHPAATGMYYVVATNRVATHLSLHSDTVYFDASGGNKDALTVSIYPNPVRDMISIIGLDKNANAKVTIADMSGYVWLSMMSGNQTVIRCSVGRLKTGNYLVNVSDGSTIKTVQFVKE